MEIWRVNIAIRDHWVVLWSSLHSGYWDKLCPAPMQKPDAPIQPARTSKRKAKDCTFTTSTTVGNSDAEQKPVKKTRTSTMAKSKGKGKADSDVSWPEYFQSVSTNITIEPSLE